MVRELKVKKEELERKEFELEINHKKILQIHAVLSDQRTKLLKRLKKIKSETIDRFT